MKEKKSNVNNVLEITLSAEEAADYLKLKPRSLYKYVKAGKIPAYKPGGRKLLFKLSDLNTYAFRNKIGNKHEIANEILGGRSI